MLLLCGKGERALTRRRMLFRIGIVTDIYSESEPLQLGARIALFGKDDGAAEIGLPAVISDSTDAPELIKIINGTLAALNEPLLGEYNHKNIRAGINDGGVFVGSRRLPLTFAETMLVRVLIARKNVPTPTEVLLRLGFLKEKTPERGAVRTHIFSINEKCRKIFGQPLIAWESGKGYFLKIQD